MINPINWKTIYEIWSKYLWPNRTSVIEQTSAMCYLEGFDIKNMDYDPKFLAYYFENRIVGVNSGHKCSNGSYRSRGLWVDPKFRKQGIGTALLTATIELAKLEQSNMIWSFPRKSSWSTYKRAGFIRSSKWQASETSVANAYCYIKL